MCVTKGTVTMVSTQYTWTASEKVSLTGITIYYTCAQKPCLHISIAILRNL